MEFEYPPVTNDAELNEWLRLLIDKFRIGEFEFQSINVTNYAQISNYRLGQVGSWDITESTIQNGTIVIDSSNNKITVNTVILDGAENEIRIGGTNIVLDADAEKITVGSNIEIDGGNDLIDVNTITIDGGNDRIRSDNYVTGSAGTGFTLEPDLLEVGNIRARGMIRTAVFQKDVISVVGGNLIVRPADVLATDMTAADASTLTVDGSESFAVGDFLRIKDGADDEWLEVTNIGSAPTYTVTRDKATEYTADANPAWTKGASVINYGASGEGGVHLTSSESNAPYMSIFTHAGTPWSGLTTQLRVGNLNGFLGYSSDLYGIAIGETEKYLKYESTNGLQVKGAVTATSMEVTGTATIRSLMQIESTGSIRSNTSGNYPYLEFSNSGLQLKTSDAGGTYGTATYTTAAQYGFGALVWIMNAHYQIPWMEVKEPSVSGDGTVASIRFYDRSALPTTASPDDGDFCFANGNFYFYYSGDWYSLDATIVP